MSDSIQRYQAYLLDPQGERVPLSGDSLIIELAPGKELQVELLSHPNHEGSLTVRAGSELESGNHAGLLSLIVVRPGASNLIHLGVEHYPWQDSPPE